MRRSNYLWYTLLIILIPLMIVILSTNIVLRSKETYVFHFNDTQAVNKIYTDVTGTELAGEISSYWSSFDKSEFQVYEKNGKFKDPVFGKKDSQVMGKVKKAVNIELAVGVVFLAISLILYRMLYVKGFRAALHKMGYISGGITIGLLIVMNILLRIKSFRMLMYNLFVGIELGKKSVLVTLLGSLFYKTYLLFATMAGVALLAILFYVNYNLTKDKRIFY